jgi:hypothetical protein
MNQPENEHLIGYYGTLITSDVVLSGVCPTYEITLEPVPEEEESEIYKITI